MRNRNVICLSIEETKELLSWWWTQTFVNDPHNLAENLAAGILPKMPVEKAQIAEMFGEFNIGEIVAVVFANLAGNRVDSVVVDLGFNDFLMVWDIEAHPPYDREGIWNNEFVDMNFVVDKVKELYHLQFVET